MRLWSLHPSYLDSKGIVALWREGLLALHVLQGKTKGYRNHPQLDRFKRSKDPVKAINAYLGAVAADAERRGYHFDTNKIKVPSSSPKLTVTDGQVEYEMKHLMKKLEVRDPKQLAEIKKELRNGATTRIHPSFRLVKGRVEVWEKSYDREVGATIVRPNK